MRAEWLSDGVLVGVSSMSSHSVLSVSWDHRCETLPLYIISLYIHICIYIYNIYCKREICQCHYAVWGYASNELQSVNTLNGCKLRSMSLTSEQFVFRVSCLFREYWYRYVLTRDYKTGFWIGRLDLLIQLGTTRNYSAIADLHILQFTVTHALEFSFFTSPILAMDLLPSRCDFRSHMKPFFTA
jgi:hypothetical protein